MAADLSAAAWSKLYNLATAANFDSDITGWLSDRRAEAYRREDAAATTKADTGTFTDDELVYAASARCLCGKGLAYPLNPGAQGFWDCSDILTGRAVPSGQKGAVLHTGRLPFIFYEVKSERQPDAPSTRPNDAPPLSRDPQPAVVDIPDIQVQERV